MTVLWLIIWALAGVPLSDPWGAAMAACLCIDVAVLLLIEWRT